MNNQKSDITKRYALTNIKKSLLCMNSVISIFSLLFIILLVSLISKENANVLGTPPSTISYGVLSQAVDDQTRLNIIKQNESSLVSDQLSGKATGISRDKIQKLNQTTSSANLLLQPMSRSYALEFTLYNAFTLLLDDFDSDVYYQTFSVVFDADMYSYDGNDMGEVYARLYLSEDGGPWFHYYTTDNFNIHGDSDTDEYEVITTFMAGYPPGHYDLLIDLYQAGYDGIVATYSSADNQALYALPIESADYDQVYADSLEIHHGGSLSSWSLIMLSLLLVSRLYRRLRPGVNLQG